VAVLLDFVASAPDDESMGVESGSGVIDGWSRTS
jgi:hypothetical protein